MGTQRHPQVQIRDRAEIQSDCSHGPSTSRAAELTHVSRAVNSPSTLISEFLEWFGDLGIFVWQVLRASVTPPFEFRELFRQLDEIGSKSLPLVALAGAATEATQQ